MSWLPQHKAPVFDATVLQHVLMGRYRFKQFWAQYNEQDHQIAMDLLNQVGLASRAHDLMTNLSGGEQQLVWLAQLQAQDADVVLLDEPTQYLDLRNQHLIVETLFDLAHKKGKLVVFSTHDLHLLAGREAMIVHLRADDSFVGQNSHESLQTIKHAIIAGH